MMNSKVLRSNSDKEILKYLEISFAEFLQNYFSFAQKSYFGAVAASAGAGVAFAVAAVAAFATFFATFAASFATFAVAAFAVAGVAFAVAAFAAVVGKDKDLLGLSTRSLIFIFVYFLIISLSTGSAVATVGAVVIPAILLGMLSFFLLSWYGNKRQILAKYKSDEQFRSKCLQKYGSRHLP